MPNTAPSCPIQHLPAVLQRDTFLCQLPVAVILLELYPIVKRDSLRVNRKCDPTKSS